MAVTKQTLEDSQRVEEALAAQRRAREAREDRARHAVVVEAREKILAAMPRSSAPRSVSPPHTFVAHANESVYPGCVRCPYPKGHEIHVGVR